MKKIFLGFLLVLVSINIPITNTNINFLGGGIEYESIIVANIEILPSVIGYFLVYGGMKELNRKHHIYDGKIFSLFIYVLVMNFIRFLMEIFAFALTVNIIWILLIIASFLVMSFIEYRLIQGYEKLENQYDLDFNTKKLFRYWKVSLVIYVFSITLLRLVPDFLLILVTGIVSLIYSILSLIAYKKASNVYEMNVHLSDNDRVVVE